MKKVISVILIMVMLVTSTLGGGLNTYAIEGDYPFISLDEEITVSVDENGGVAIFAFVPDVTDTYFFYSYNSDIDTYGSLYDSQMNNLVNDDDGGDTHNFKVSYLFNAGETYYFKSRPYSETTSGSYSVKLIRAVVAESVKIDSGSTIDKIVGSNESFYAEFFPEYARPEKCTWSSDNEAVATVDKNGYVSFLTVGEVTISVITENSLTASCTITVKEPVMLSVEQPVMVTIEDNKEQYVKFIPNESGYYTIYISEPSNDNTAGLVLLNSSFENLNETHIGRFCNYFTADEVYYVVANYIEWEEEPSGSYYINVVASAPATSMSIDLGCSYEGRVGDYKLLSPVFEPEFSITEEVEWTSSDNDVVYVDSSGYISLLEEGTAVITATSTSGLVATCTVTSEDYPEITLDKPQTVTLDADNHATYFKFVPEEDGYYSFYSNSDKDTYASLFDRYFSNLASDDDSGAEMNFRIGYNMVAGEKYFIYVSYYGDTPVSYDVFVEKLKKITNLEVVSLPEKNEYMQGCVTNLDYSGLKLKATWSDGSSTEWEYNAGDPYIGGYYVTLYASENINNDGKIYVNCGDLTASFTITLIENPVESIELISGEFVYVEQFGGYFSERYNDDNDSWEDYYYYEYINYMPEDIRVKINYKNGSSKVINQDELLNGYGLVWHDEQDKEPWILGSNNNLYVSFLGVEIEIPVTVIKNPVERIELVKGTSIEYTENVNGYIQNGENGEYFCYYTDSPTDAEIKIIYTDGSSRIAKVYEQIDNYYVDWDDLQDKQPWTVGTNNLSEILYLGHSVVLPITVKKNNVKSIEYVSGKLTLIENVNGIKDFIYDEETGEEIEYFCYYMPTLFDDIKIKINYLNEESKIVDLNDKNYLFGLFFWEDQQQKPWVLGDDNYFTVTFMGKETKVPASVIENPISRLELVTAPTKEYFYGDNNYGSTFENGDYEFYPRDLNGFSFKVHYVDGSSEIFTYKDIDELGYINGYLTEFDFSHNEDLNYNPAIGDFPVTFIYMGKTLNYTVVLKQSPVTEIKITKLPNAVEKYYLSDFIGTEFVITYADGSTKTVVLTDENIIYKGVPHLFNIWYEVNVDGSALIIERYYDESDETHYAASYLGAICKFQLEEKKDSRIITSVEISNYVDKGDGMNVKLTYIDKTTQTLKIDTVSSYNFQGPESYCYGKTENGLLYYYVSPFYDYEGNVSKYTVQLLDCLVDIEVVKYDVNRDGALNLKDLVALAQYVAKWEVEVYEAELDINGDGIVDLSDVDCLAHKLAGWE